MPQWEVSQHYDETSPIEGTAGLGVGRLSPMGLLAWIESQLGLVADPVPYVMRIVQYAARLRRDPHPSITVSLRNDQWATAAELLRRRDDLLINRWDPNGPTTGIAQAIARAEREGSPLAPGIPDRIHAILRALDAGQQMPPHQVTSVEADNDWPPLWKTLLSRLQRTAAPAATPTATVGSGLHGLQTNLLRNTAAPVDPDATLRVLESRSAHTTTHALAAWISRYEGDRRRVIIYCNDEPTTRILEATMRTHGLPTMGARGDASAQPAFQVLPLVLRLLWEPVNVYAVLDFLLLPQGPIRRGISRKLARALENQPGFESDAWNEVVAELTAQETDPKGENRALLEEWFTHERGRHGATVPTDLVRQRASIVAQWGAGRAKILADQGEDDYKIAMYTAVAAQAKALGQIMEAFGSDVTEPQLSRMLDAVQSAHARNAQFASQSTGPRWVASLADIPRGTECVVWVGTGDDPAHTARPRNVAGQPDDGTTALRTLRAAEKRGLCNTKRLIVFQFPHEEERRTHPVWLQAKASLPQQPAIRLEDILTGQSAIGPEFSPSVAVPAAVAAQPVRPEWPVPHEYVVEPVRDSATSLENRLACPINWFLDRVAQIRPSPIFTIPRERRLMGEFAHGVLATVLGDGGTVPSTNEVESRVATVFDETLARNASPLAQPHALQMREALRRNLIASARILVEALHAGEYRVKGMETFFEVDLGGRKVAGRIDCLLENDEGEAVVDLKYGGLRYRRDTLADGRALQLATYAKARTVVDGLAVHGAAYLILENGVLLAPRGSPLRGSDPAKLVDGPPIMETWSRFQDALQVADGWMRREGPIPARPLQPPTDWPTGTHLVLDSRSNEQSVCMFCNFTPLCGLRRPT